jgi:hypothetical protein
VATFGANPTLTTFDFSGVNTDNEIFAPAATVPENARCQSITCNVGRHTAGNVNVQFCIWDASTNGLIVASSAIAIGAGRADHTIGIADTVLKAGRSVYVGFWRDPALDAEWGVAAAGSFNFAPLAGGAGGPSNPIAPNACAGPFVCGTMRAFVTYIPITVWKGVGGAWVRTIPTVGRSAAWPGATPVKVGRAGVWNQIG